MNVPSMITFVGYVFLLNLVKSSAIEGEYAKPNALGLRDGTRYNLTDMKEDLVNALIEYASGAGTSILPKLNKEYEL